VCCPSKETKESNVNFTAELLRLENIIKNFELRQSSAFDTLVGEVAERVARANEIVLKESCEQVSSVLKAKVSGNNDTGSLVHSFSSPSASHVSKATQTEEQAFVSAEVYEALQVTFEKMKGRLTNAKKDLRELETGLYSPLLC
jgi:hypothetical protein